MSALHTRIHMHVYFSGCQGGGCPRIPLSSFNFPWSAGSALILSIQSSANHPPLSTMASR